MKGYLIAEFAQKLTKKRRFSAEKLRELLDAVGVSKGRHAAVVSVPVKPVRVFAGRSGLERYPTPSSHFRHFSAQRFDLLHEEWLIEKMVRERRKY